MKIKRSAIILIIFTVFATAYIGALSANAASPESDFRFKASTGTITSYIGTSGVVVIPETIGGVAVTAIGNNAFYRKTKITRIIIPDCITSIGSQAFMDCSGLTSVNIPDGITSIGVKAFEGCSCLTGLTLPDSVTSIGQRAFYNCSGLTEINIPDGLTSIEGYTFYGCAKLTELAIPGTVTSIGDYAFCDCGSLTEINIPDGITNISFGTFMNCYKLTEIMIPDSVTNIGDWSFENCTGLTSIDIPVGVTSIGAGAFFGCSGITNITIPDGVTSIEGQTFGMCTGLKSISIPDNITTIKSGAFWCCYELQNVIIPSEVISLGYSAFTYCTNLNRVLFMGDPPTLGSLGGLSVFDNCPADLKICYLFGNESFIGEIVDGKWNGYDAVPMVTVAYDGNGGESGGVPADENLYEAGGTASVLGNPGALEKTGFSFKGWNTKADGSGTTYDEDDSITVDGMGHITLYAVWEAITLISVDVTWGSMEFTYSDGIWNPETHEYEGTGWTSGVNANRISVTSSSNMPVTVSYSYTQDAGYLAVNGSFTNGINPVTSNELSAGDVTPQSCEVYLNLSGKPPECNINKIGSVTVTITE